MLDPQTYCNLPARLLHSYRTYYEGPLSLDPKPVKLFQNTNHKLRKWRYNSPKSPTLFSAQQNYLAWWIISERILLVFFELLIKKNNIKTPLFRYKDTSAWLKRWFNQLYYTPIDVVLWPPTDCTSIILYYSINMSQVRSAFAVKTLSSTRHFCREGSFCPKEKQVLCQQSK